MLVLYMFVGYKIMLGPLTIVGNGGSLTLSLSLNSRPQIQRFPVSLLFLLHNYLAVKLTELLHIAIDMWFTYVLNMRKKHIAMLVSMQKVSMLICPFLLLSLKSPILWASKPPTPRQSQDGLCPEKLLQAPILFVDHH